MRNHFTIAIFLCILMLRVSSQTATHSLTFETSEVTQPTLSMMPDGRAFVFPLLGHIFKMPVAGGKAVQLTFGPYYEYNPVVSPDGKKVAFVSNRDGSDGNIFILDFATKKISKVTHEFMAGSPAWSADGSTIAFLSFLKREEYPLDKVPFFGAGDMASVKTISVNGANLQQITGAGTYLSPFFREDGSLAWAVTERRAGAPASGSFMAPPPVNTFFETISKGGSVTRFGSLNERPGHIALDNAKNGFYYITAGLVQSYTFGDTASNTIAPFRGSDIALALSPDGKTAYAAGDRKLWKINLNSGTREQITWSATVRMDVAYGARHKWSAPKDGIVPPSEILSPILSPDGKTLVFMAAGYLWIQPSAGGIAKKLIGDDSFQMEPSFSPDGSEIAFVCDQKGIRKLQVIHLSDNKVRTLTTLPGSAWAHQPSWSADGKNIVYQQSGLLGWPYKFIKTDVATGEDTVSITSTANSWNGRPQFSADGHAIFFTARREMMANVYRLALQPGAKPEAVTSLNRHAHDGRVSPDGKWLALRRNAEIWIAPLQPHPSTDEDFKLFSKSGGRSFDFTSDASAIVYTDGNKVLRQEIETHKVNAIPVQLQLSPVTTPPVLISGVHVLDFNTGRFTDETFIYIEKNRIVAIGNNANNGVAPGTIRMDARGKYAIPGLMDSHVHTAWSNQQITEDRYIAYGVTSVRDVGSRLDVINALRDRGYSTNLPVPRYFSGGDIFEGLVPLWGDAFLEINSIQEGRDYVRYAKAHGADFIKVYASLPWFIKTEVAAEAARQGLPVVGHGISLEEITRSINFGIHSSEHGGPTNDDIVKLMAASGTWFDPTPDIFGAGTTLKLADPTTLDAKFKTFNPPAEIEAAHPGRVPTEGQLAAWKNTLANLKRTYDKGVKFLDGTDALMTGVFHGPSVHWVLQFFNDAGIPAIDVLKIATLNAAASVGASQDLGSLEPGKLADILILNDNPLEDIKNTMHIWRVIKNGTVFNPATMRD